MKELAAWRKAAQQAKAVAVPALPAPVRPEPKAPESKAHECDWHERGADPAQQCVKVPVEGTQERDVQSWLDHLRGTLYVKDTGRFDAFEHLIRNYWERMEVTACRTQANRSFHVRCKKCNEYSFGQYGEWVAMVDPKRIEHARDALAQFFKYHLRHQPQT